MQNLTLRKFLEDIGSGSSQAADVASTVARIATAAASVAAAVADGEANSKFAEEGETYTKGREL